MTSGSVDVGSVLAGHRLDSITGQGGMGIVYRATHLGLDREVALKVISPALASDASFRHRFKRESRTAASLRHPHIVTIFDAGEDESHLYITMEFIEGADLGELIADRGRLDAGLAVELISQIADALDAAHASALVHRDVKPANILLQDHGDHLHAYLTDFGLTRHVTSVGGVTKTGQWVGTLDYVAPEQIQGEYVDSRADVYSLACVLFEALTGEVPFPRDSDLAKMWAQVHDDPPRPSDRVDGIAPELDAVVHRGLAKDRENRFESAGEFASSARTALGESAGTAPGPEARVPALTKAAGTTPASPPTPRIAQPTRPRSHGDDGDAQEGNSPGRTVQTRRRLALLGVSAVVALVAGFIVSGLGSGGGGSTTVSRGNMKLDYASGWSRDVTGGRPLDGFKVSHFIALDYDPLSGAGVLRAGRLRDPAKGTDPLPAALRMRLGKVQMRTVQVGGVEALSYQGKTHDKAQQPTGVKALIVPTDKGYQGIACEAPEHQGDFFSACDDVMGSMRLVGAQPVALGPDPKLARILGETFAHLDKAQAKYGSELKNDDYKGQADAASSLAVAYGKAKDGFAGYEPRSQDAAAVGELTGSLMRLEAGYNALARAADDENRAAYSDASDQIAAAAKDFSAAVAELEKNGYQARN